MNKEDFIGYCPNCSNEIYDEGWRLDDGPCLDNLFYCMERECRKNSKFMCGCKKEKERITYEY